MIRHTSSSGSARHLVARTAILRDRRLHARVVTLVGTSRRAQTVVAVVVSSLAALAVGRGLSRADDARLDWTGSEKAYVLLRSVDDNEVIVPADVREVLLPPALAPDGRLDTLRPGMRARVALPARVVLVETMVDGHVDYPASWRVVALPEGTAMPPASPGDAVDVIAGNEMLVEAAVVVSVAPLTLAVPAERAPDVAAAVRLGEVSVLAR